MPLFEDNLSPYLTVVEQGSTPSNPASGNQKVFVRTSDHLLCYVNSSGTVTPVGSGMTNPMTTKGDVILGDTSGVPSRLAAGTSTYVLTSNGAGAFPSWQAGGGASTSFLGYNTVGGSQQAMTTQRVYSKQITAGGSGNSLLGIQAYVDQTVEATIALGFFLHADSGADTIGDLLIANLTPLLVLAHGTGGGVSYPARWFGAAMGYPLTASTKYWIAVTCNAGTGAPRLYYDGSGSDRYYNGGVTPYYNDGAYNAGTQTNTTNKHSIRALVL